MSRRQEQISAIAGMICNLHTNIAVDDPRAEAERINAEDGWGFDLSADHPNNWVQYRGVSLDHDEFEQAWEMGVKMLENPDQFLYE